MWWKKKEKKEEAIEEKKEEDLLKELCRDDAGLYDFLGRFLVINPLAGISQKDIETLTEEAEKSGNYSPAVDKAIFEGTKNPEEREKYIKIMQDLASKTIHATEQRKEEAEKEGLTDRAASLERKIEDQKFMSERAEDILKIASVFYSEKLMQLEEDQRREARGKEREMADGAEWRMGEQEKRDREARKKDRKKMSKEERTEAEQQDKREELAAEERKAAREEEKRKAASEEKRIEEQEKRDREARRDERSQNQ